MIAAMEDYLEKSINIKGQYGLGALDGARRN